MKKTLAISLLIPFGGAGILSLGTVESRAITTADFVFIIDGTSSMAGEIAAVKNGLGNFVTGLNAAAVDARFSIVLFGGAPELVLDWTTSQAATEQAFNQISVSGAVAGFQNNHNVNPEAGLEAIRVVLNEVNNSTLSRDNVGGSGPLTFRDGARKNLILVTDEDSDLPFFAANRNAGQTTEDPPASLSAPWQLEIDQTAQAAIENQAFLNLLINASDVPSRAQYGDPAQDASDSNLLNFDPITTLNNLVTAGFGDSLEAQLLSAGLIGRSFNIQQVDDAAFVDNFFAAKIEEIVTNPTSTPESGSSLLMLCTGLFASGLFLRARVRA